MQSNKKNKEVAPTSQKKGENNFASMAEYRANRRAKEFERQAKEQAYKVQDTLASLSNADVYLIHSALGFHKAVTAERKAEIYNKLVTIIKQSKEAI